MELKVKEINNLIINSINTNRFKTNIITFSFISKTDGKDNYLTNFLTKILLNNTKKYNTKIKYAKKLEDLYSANITSNFLILGKLKIIKFSIEYINNKYLDENIDNKAVDLLIETIFNPNVVNNKFDKKSFDLIKRNIITNKKRLDEYPVAYSIHNFLKEFSDGPSYYSLSGELDEIENIDEEKLYSYYKTLFDMNLDITILGDNINDNLVDYLCNKLKKYRFKRNNYKELYVNSITKNKVKVKEETKKFNQSHLIMGYKLKDINDYERKNILPVYNIILGGDINSLLFKIVREDNNLCYSINSSSNHYENTITITSGINKTNYSKAVSLVKKCLSEMTKKDVVKNMLEIAKKNIDTSLNVFYDDYNEMILYAILKNYYDIDSIEKKRELISKVNIDEVLKLNKHIKLDTIYFLKGDK